MYNIDLMFIAHDMMRKSSPYSMAVASVVAAVRLEGLNECAINKLIEDKEVRYGNQQ